MPEADMKDRSVRPARKSVDCTFHGERAELASHKSFLLIHVFLRVVPRDNQRVHAWLGQLGAVALETHVQKLAADPML
jgi:hypothetical protein